MSDTEWGKPIVHDAKGPPEYVDAGDLLLYETRGCPEEWTRDEAKNLWWFDDAGGTINRFRLKAIHAYYQIPANQGFPTSELTAEVVAREGTYEFNRESGAYEKVVFPADEWVPDQRTVEVCIEALVAMDSTDDYGCQVHRLRTIEAFRALLKPADPDEEEARRLLPDIPWVPATGEYEADDFEKMVVFLAKALKRGREMERGK